MIMQSRIKMRQEARESTLDSGSNVVLKYSLGIDVGKDSLDVCMYRYYTDQHGVICGSRKFPNTSAGLSSLYSWSQKKCGTSSLLYVTMEATGVYYENAAYYFDSHDVYVSVLLPSRVKQYLRSRGQRSKNDRLDAVGIARMGAEVALERWHRPSESAITLRQMTRYCESLQQIRTECLGQRESFRHSSHQNASILSMIEEEIRHCDKLISKIKKEVERLLLEDETLRPRIENILCIKGLGLYTLAVILSETGFFEMFHSQRQLVSYCGYDIVENQSGRRSGKTKISKKGNAHIRRALHMPALNMKTYREPRLNALWERVYERSKKKMVAYVAVQRRLLLLIYTLWKKNRKYNPAYKTENEDVKLQQRGCCI